MWQVKIYILIIKDFTQYPGVYLGHPDLALQV
jgi:hypothetical protein